MKNFIILRLLDYDPDSRDFRAILEFLELQSEIVDNVDFCAWLDEYLYIEPINESSTFASEMAALRNMTCNFLRNPRYDLYLDNKKVTKIERQEMGVKLCSRASEDWTCCYLSITTFVEGLCMSNTQHPNGRLKLEPRLHVSS